MTAEAGPYTRKERKTTESEKLIATFELGMPTLIRGAIIIETKSKQRNPTPMASLGNDNILPTTAAVPRDVMRTIVKANNLLRLSIGQAGELRRDMRRIKRLLYRLQKFYHLNPLKYQIFIEVESDPCT